MKQHKYIHRIVFLLILLLAGWAGGGTGSLAAIRNSSGSNAHRSNAEQQTYPLTIKLPNKNGISSLYISTDALYQNIHGEQTLDIFPGDHVYIQYYINPGYKCTSITLNGSEYPTDNGYVYFEMPESGVEAVFNTTYSPESPSDPQPGDVTKKYRLKLSRTPFGGGSVTGEGEYPAGEQVYLGAYTNTGYRFTRWTENGETISTDPYFRYMMPASDVSIVGNFVYDPADPSDPPVAQMERPLTVTATPAGAGSFWISDDRVPIGTEYTVYAYPNNGYRVTGWVVNGEPVKTEGSNLNSFSGIMTDQGADIVCIFVYDPSSPSNPGANHYYPETGELIIDEFTKGNLYTAIAATVGQENFNNVSSIIVKGQLDRYDFGALSYLGNVSLIDLSRTWGMAYAPSYAFSGIPMASLILPSSISSLEDYCFYDCENLTSLTIYAQEPPKCSYYTFSSFPNKANCTVYVPASAVGLYTEADYWKDFTILPIASDAFSLQVNLPEEAADGRYKNNSLELVNATSGVRQRYVISDRMLYTFNGLQKDEKFTLFMYSQTGLELGRLEGIVIPDHDSEVTFDKLLPLHDVTASVMTPDGEDVTSQTTVEWHRVLEDGSLSYLQKGATIGQVPQGQQLLCRVGLNDKLGVKYSSPDDVKFTVDETGKNCRVTLAPFRMIELSGKVVDSDNAPLGGASVSVNQILNGRYTKSYTGKTDNAGAWVLSVSDAPQSTVTYSANECVTRIDTIAAFDAGANSLDLGSVQLNSIVGARISYTLTYQEAGEEKSDYYADYKNIAISVFNVTQNRQHEQVSNQYPLLAVLDENINDGDELRLTASSKSNTFRPVEKTVTIGKDQRADVTFDIIGKGGISAVYEMTDNPAVVAMLYDGNGEFRQKKAYVDAKVKFTDLADGEYTIVSMGASDMMNSIVRLLNFDEIGLSEGRDYVKNNVSVSTGNLAEVKIPEVPALDESLFYYTDDNTGFTSNKSSIVTGNYLTLRASIGFKNLYEGNVGNVVLTVDLPAGCDLVEQSVIQGPNMLPYTLDNNRLTIQLGDKYRSQTRFCVVPTTGGLLNVSAFISFDLEGKKVTQPIGTAVSDIKNIGIVVPTVVANSTFTASGSATPNSEISVYDESSLLGTGRVNAAGNWKIDCELNEPYNMSVHPVHAQILTPAGNLLSSETKNVLYDRNALQVSKVTMYHFNPEMNRTFISEFDFLNPKTSATQWTVYYPNKKFTYTVEFTDNNPERITDVVLYIHTADNRIVPVLPAFDENKKLWYAEIDMGHSSDGYYPVNCSVDFNYVYDAQSDRNLMDELIDNIDADREDVGAALAEVAQLTGESEALLADLEARNGQIQTLFDGIQTADNEVDSETLKTLYTLLGWEYNESNHAADPDYDGSQEAVDALMADVEELLNDTFDLEEIDNTFNVLLSASDQILESMDENSEIDEKSLDNYNDREFVIETAIGNYDYAEKKASDIDTSVWEEDNITRINLTDGSVLLVYFNNDVETIILDQTTDRAWVINLRSEAANSRDLPDKITGQDIINKLKESFSALNIAKEAISNKISDWSDALKEEMACLRKQMNALDDEMMKELVESSKTQGKIDKLERTLKTMERQAAEGKTVYYKGEVVNFKDKIKQLKSQRMELLKKASKHSDHIAKCKDKINSFKMKSVTKAAILTEVLGYIDVVKGVVQIIDIVQYGIRDMIAWNSMIDYILPCEDDAAKALTIKKDAEKYRNKWGRGYLSAGSLTIVSTGLSGYMQFNKAAKFLMKTVGALVADFLKNTAKQVYEETKCSSRKTFNEIKRRRANLKCKRNCGEDGKPACPEPPDSDDGGNNGGNGGSNGSGAPDDNVQIDPSGYVYEAVPENRVEGVRATIYYKESKEDMYGDPYEEIILWNAEEYAQQNPLFTDENGMYRWDVPQGLWQVKFEKEGYVTAYSEWLPVPPPQLDVNIGIVQNRQPEVLSAHAYEDGVEVQFDKYMNPATLNTANIYVTANGSKVNGEVQLIDSALADEYADEEDIDATRFASRARFVPEQPLASNTGEIRLVVSRDVLSYAGIPMAQTFSQELDVEKEVKAITADDVKVLYDSTKELTVFAVPGEAAAGKILHITSSSDLILSVDPAEITLDDEGKGVILLKGSLPGRAQLHFSIDNVAVSGDCTVDVVTEIASAEPPRASRPSGTVLYRGTKIELSTDSKNAVIYYTTDGTCPCDKKGSRRKYTTPIVVNDDITILAVTVLEKDDEMSETIEFKYTVKRSALDLSMSQGWTWISHNFESPVMAAQVAADERVRRIVSQTQEVIRDPNVGLVGNLSELLPCESYKVEASATTPAVRFTDYAWNPNTIVSLIQGWNWLGYPLQQTMTVDEAFALADPEALDMIVGQDGFAQFDGESWVGTLQTLSPGSGYLYHSLTAKDFCFNTSIVSNASARHTKGIASGAPLAVDIHKYRSVMPVIATVINEADASALNSDFEVTAFCGSECRGIGRLVNGKIMFNVYGEPGDQIAFRITDAEGTNEYGSGATVDFSENALGNIFDPHVFAINSESGITDVRYDGNLSVRVDGDRLRINGIDPENISLVEIYDTDGRKMMHKTSVPDGGIIISGLSRGVYVVIVKADGLYTYHKIALH